MAAGMCTESYRAPPGIPKSALCPSSWGLQSSHNATNGPKPHPIFIGTQPPPQAQPSPFSGLHFSNKGLGSQDTGEDKDDDL